MILLEELSIEHTDNQKQFGFKKKSSCQHAVFTLNQAIRISTKTKKRLYICAIDASKAFDKINREILWTKLIRMKISPAIIHPIMLYYNQSQMIIMNDNEYSNLFKTSVGVKQGGPLSPKLFSIYIEELIDKIEGLEEGVEYEGGILDIICYADDILIMSNTKQGLQRQLKVIEQYGKMMGIKYNPDKTKLMIYNTKCKRSIRSQREDLWQDEVTLDGVRIQKVDTMRYLGMEINETNKNKSHIDKRRRLAISSAVRLKTLGIWTEHTNPYLKGHLYKTFIRPVLMYGIENLDITKTELNNIRRIEGNIIKYMIGISNRCRTSNLLLALNIEDTETYIENVKAEFVIRLIENLYTTKFIEILLRSNEIKDLWRNMEYVFDHEGVDKEELIEFCKILKYINKNRTESLRRNNDTVRSIKEIFNNKDNRSMTTKLFELLRF